ncbi:hypothetical protein DL98DRAFT_588921 [Cadophora sp. DSE1049]|nr:hypothetical protein DL98DRAFT_588921 [Cadophora sp. DSE1049]
MLNHSTQSPHSTQAVQSPERDQADPRPADAQGPQSPDSMDSFPSFSKLPNDVQGIIWDMSNNMPRIRISNGVNVPEYGEGRVIQVYITQTPYFQPIPHVPIVGRQPVPPGRYEYRWRLWTSEAPNELDFINRDTWEEYQRRYPHRLELRDDPRSEVVRFDANRDTIFVDIQSLFALSDYATPRGEPGVGGQAYGHGPPEATRKAQLIGFENVQRLTIPISYPPERQGLTWLMKNVFTGIHPSIPGIESVPWDEAPNPASDPRPSISEDLRFPNIAEPLVTSRWTLRNFLLLQLQNIFNYQSLAADREVAAREFFLRLPTT